MNWVSVVYYVAWLIHMNGFFWKEGKKMLIVRALGCNDLRFFFFLNDT